MKNIFWKITLVLTAIILPAISLADLGGVGGGPLIENPLKFNSIAELINAVLELIVNLGTPLLILAFVYVGFLFVLARGNDSELTNAKRAFFWTVIGAALVLGAFVISAVIQNTINQLQ